MFPSRFALDRRAFLRSTALGLSCAATPGSTLFAADDPFATERNVFVRPPKQSERVVSRLIGKEADATFAMLPSGEIVIDQSGGLTPTTEPYKAASVEDLAKELTTNVFPGFKTAKSKRYLFVYNCSEGFRKLTSGILESMFTPLQNYFKRERFEIREPEHPLVVVIFETHQEMREYREIPESVVAFYEPLSNRVSLSERSRLVESMPELGVPQAFATIAHEGVHQILHNIGVQHRLTRWPAWIAEGLPEYFAPCELSQSGTWKGVGKRNDLRMLELMGLPAPKAGRKTVVEQVVSAPQLTSTGYAAAWATTHFSPSVARSSCSNTFASSRRWPRSSKPTPRPNSPVSRSISATTSSRSRRACTSTSRR
jgi:hypothetical protein